MAGTEVGSLYYDLSIDDKQLTTQLDKADKKVKDFGDSTGKTAEQVSDGFKSAAKVMAVTSVALTAYAKNATDFTLDLVKTSKSLSREIGISTTEASRLTAAFTRMGLEGEEAQQMFGIFSKQIVASTENAEKNRLATEKLQLQIDATKREITDTTSEIKKHGDKSGELNIKLKELNNTLKAQQDGLSKSSDAFQRLGVSTKNAEGQQKDFTTLLFEVADKFKAMPDGIDKTATAMELFGRSGKDMIKVLNLGSQGIKDLEKQADALGLTLNEETIGRVNELIQSQKSLKQEQDALKIAVGTATAPALAEFNKGLTDVIASLIATDSPLRGLTVSVLAFGGPIFGAAAGVLQLTANLVQAWPAITGVTGATWGWVAANGALIGPLAAVVAGIVAVKVALDSVKRAWNDVYNAQAAVDSLGSDAQIIDLQKQAKAYRDRGQAVPARITNAISANMGGNASGTDNWGGGLTWVGERGPEIVNLPRGSQVIPNDVSRQMMRNGGMSNKTTVNIGTIMDRSDAEYILRRLDRNQERLNMGMSQA